MQMSRSFGMPTADTFGCPPIAKFVQKWWSPAYTSIDPFARNSTFATFTNDLNPETVATFHMDAEVFCNVLAADGVRADFLFFDPPYSPRQISECYKGVGQSVTAKDTQNAALYRRVRDAADRILSSDAICLSFGWNSAGMGKKRGWAIEEILLVAHGGAHNDTICVAERKL